MNCKRLSAFIVEFLFESLSSKIYFRRKMNWKGLSNLLGTTSNHTTLEFQG